MISQLLYKWDGIESIARVYVCECQVETMDKYFSFVAFRLMALSLFTYNTFISFISCYRFLKNTMCDPFHASICSGLYFMHIISMESHVLFILYVKISFNIFHSILLSLFRKQLHDSFPFLFFFFSYFCRVKWWNEHESKLSKDKWETQNHCIP